MAMKSTKTDKEKEALKGEVEGLRAKLATMQDEADRQAEERDTDDG